MTNYKVVKLMNNGVEYCIKGSSPVVDVLVVAGGGSGGSGGIGGGGGAGGVIYRDNYALLENSYEVCVGSGGTRECVCNNASPGVNGQNSSFGDLVACGGGGGGAGATSYYAMIRGCDGGSGGGGFLGDSCVGCCYLCGAGMGVSFQGTNGGVSQCCCTGGGGGGAGGSGCNWVSGGCYCCGCCTNSFFGGGYGIKSDIEGTTRCYAGGGGGGGYNCVTRGRYGGGDGGSGYYGCPGCPGTTCGSGGGGGYSNKGGGTGANGVVIVRYPTSCGYNMSGGCKYTCGGWTIHCFTSNDTFTVG